MEIIAATGNKYKVKEFSEILGEIPGITVKTMREAGFDGDIIEDGATFTENALIKARAICKFTGKPSLADDSGLSVDALSGAPGIYSARYAATDGKNADDKANNEKLLSELKNVPSGERSARYVCAIALVLPDGREFTTLGTCEGQIAMEERGCGGFGYDPLFYCVEYAKTYGELAPEEKHAISHRGKALRNMKKIMADIFITQL